MFYKAMTLSGPIPVLVMVCVFSAGVVLGVTGFGSRAVFSRTDHGRLRSAFQEGGSEMTTVSHKVRWVVLTGALLGSAVWVLLGLGPARKPDKEAPSPSSGTEEREPPPRYCGWIPDPQAVRECLEKMGMGEFRATPKRAEDPGSHLDEPVYLWETVRRVTGEVLPGRDQGTVGSCVAVATASALEHLQCVQIAAGEKACYRDVASEVIYGGSRVQIGGGRIRGDGSIGAWAARWVKDYGVVPRDIYHRYDLRQYNEQLCRELGRRGVPQELIAIARQHPVLEVMRVQSWEEARSALHRGYPILVCSDQGFRMERDRDGFCAPRGIWYHAMALIGCRGGERPGGFLLNSWGDQAHTGPRVPPHAPPAGFWVDAHVLDRMLRQGDSWAFARLIGFADRTDHPGSTLDYRPASVWDYRPALLPLLRLPQAVRIDQPRDRPANLRDPPLSP